VRLYSRPGNDLTSRFPSIADALAQLRPRSCIIAGEAVVVDENGVPSFDRLRYRRRDGHVVLCAFDLLELNGNDLRGNPIEQRKAALAKLLSRAMPSIQFNEHIEEDGALVFKHACKLGFEGIVSKRKGSPYRSGRTEHWHKSKNPAAAAVTRELLARIMHDGEELRDGCGKKRAIHVASRCSRELHRAPGLRHSRHERRYLASLRPSICPAQESHN
jgi:ATP-dependent DNA ligase